MGRHRCVSRFIPHHYWLSRCSVHGARQARIRATGRDTAIDNRLAIETNVAHPACPMNEQHQEPAEYLRDASRSLADYAREHNLVVVAHILDLAHLEAAKLAFSSDARVVKRTRLTRISTKPRNR